MRTRGPAAPFLIAILVLAACSSRTPPPKASVSLGGVRLATLERDPALCLYTLGRIGGVSRAADRPIHKGCGYRDALSVDRVGGLGFNRAFVATCRLAAAFAAFERHVLQPAARRTLNAEVVGMTHWGTYACRNRDHRQAGPRSEHARANAIDVAAFLLDDGRRITVADGWDAGGGTERFLHAVHKGACGIFQGVLGPDANHAHRNHFHFDMGRWRFCE
jgi:hypothetical protein